MRRHSTLPEKGWSLSAGDFNHSGAISGMLIRLQGSSLPSTRSCLISGFPIFRFPRGDGGFVSVRRTARYENGYRFGGFSGYDSEQVSEKELAHIFWKYGEERFSRQIARGIVLHRQKHGDITTTGSLVSVIREILPAPVQRKMGGHPARRVFQALRIAVNDELAVLEQGLEQAYRLCRNGSIVVVVSYHSLEDRIVKNSFRDRHKEGLAKILTRRPVIPSEEEVEQNYKARSAKLRTMIIETREGKEVEGKW